MVPSVTLAWQPAISAPSWLTTVAQAGRGWGVVVASKRTLLDASASMEATWLG